MIKDHFNGEKSLGMREKAKLRNGWTQQQDEKNPSEVGPKQLSTAAVSVTSMPREAKSAQNQRARLIKNE